MNLLARLDIFRFRLAVRLLRWRAAQWIGIAMMGREERTWVARYLRNKT